MTDRSTCRRRRATPVAWAARATPAATAGATALLNTLGMMYSSLSSERPTQAAIARAAEGVGEPPLDLARVGGTGHPALHEVHALGAPAIDRAVLVHADDVAHTARQEDLDGRGAGGADARHNHAELLEVLLHDAQRVEQRQIGRASCRERV